MLPAGLLGDRFGRRTVIFGALALFGVGSVACAYPPRRAVHRGAGSAWGCWGGHHRHGVVGADGAVHQGGTAEGGRGLGGRRLRGAADRPGPGRLAADPLLVGLGVPDECAGRAYGDRRDSGADPRVARAAASRPRPDRDPRVDGGPGRGDVRAHRGGPARLARSVRDRLHGRRRRRGSSPSSAGSVRSPGAGRGRWSTLRCSGRTPTRGASSCRRSASWP